MTTDREVLRSDLKIDVVPQWTLALRGDLPLVERNPITPGNPTGEFVGGLGDIDLQAALIKTVNARWATGAAIRIIAPTGAPDLTSGKWQALPIVGVRYMLPELSEGSFFTGLARYDVSFAGDPSKRNISNLQIAPTLNIMLPDHWFVTFLSRSRRPHQLRRSDYRPNRSIVLANGFPGWPRFEQDHHHFFGNWRPRDQRLSRLRF